jgi:hypothetical protein
MLHADTTSFYGVFFMAPYLYLFTFILSGIVERRYENAGEIAKEQSFLSYCLSHIWYVLIDKLVIA